MDTARYKGRIRNVSPVPNGGYTYDRATPGVTFPNDGLSTEELANMSSAVRKVLYTGSGCYVPAMGEEA